MLRREWVWAVDSRPPFADAEGDEEEDYFDEDEDAGEIDVTDDGDLDEYDEDADNIDKFLERRIRKSLENHIVPKRQYLKALSQDQYNKIIGKDAYGFLHGHEDEVIEVLAVGKQVSEYFSTITPSDVREVYRIIVSSLEEMGWS